MQIDYNVLIAYGGVAQKIAKGDFIFKESSFPRYFFQILQGEVRVFSSNREGRILLQGIFKNGQSFGEAPLLNDKQYPNTAQATQATVIVKISKEKFISLLKDFPETTTALLFSLTKRIYKNALLAQIWVAQTPEEKILLFLKNYKDELKTTDQILISHTRQQIADFTGLRVETVIRTIKKMCTQGKVKIVNHRLYY